MRTFSLININVARITPMVFTAMGVDIETCLFFVVGINSSKLAKGWQVVEV